MASSSAQANEVLACAVARSDDLGQIVLQFDTVAGSLALSHRDLWGPGDGIVFNLEVEAFVEIAVGSVTSTGTTWSICRITISGISTDSPAMVSGTPNGSKGTRTAV